MFEGVLFRRVFLPGRRAECVAAQPVFHHLETNSYDLQSEL